MSTQNIESHTRHCAFNLQNGSNLYNYQPFPYHNCPPSFYSNYPPYFYNPNNYFSTAHSLSKKQDQKTLEQKDKQPQIITIKIEDDSDQNQLININTNQHTNQNTKIKTENTKNTVFSTPRISQKLKSPHSSEFFSGLRSILYDLVQSFINQEENLMEIIEFSKNQINQICKNENEWPYCRQMFSHTIQLLSKRLKHFRKTKEQMHKYLFRRLYQDLKTKMKDNYSTELKKIEDQHQKNLKTFKSMNIAFMTQEFSTPGVLEMFTQYLQNKMRDQFTAENENKVNKLVDAIVQCWKNKKISVNGFQKMLPWSNKAKDTMYKLGFELIRKNKHFSFGC